jgi:hypothetical protein
MIELPKEVQHVVELPQEEQHVIELPQEVQPEVGRWSFPRR